MAALADTVCVICRRSFDDALIDSWISLTPRGIATLEEFSILRNDSQLQDHLFQNPADVKVHVSCRKKYTNRKSYEQECKRAENESSSTIPAKKLRSSATFNWKSDCFFCAKSVALSMRNVMGRKLASSAATLTIHETILEACAMRNDAWSLQVQGRLHTCADLVAAEAVYHRSCYNEFCNKQRRADNSSVAAGCPQDVGMSKAFDEMCSMLEAADNQLYTIEDLIELLAAAGENDEDIYSVRHLKRKLEEKYENHIVFSHVAGRKNVICFREMAHRVINDKWYNDRSENFEDESHRIVTAAAKLVKAQLREHIFEYEEYPKTSSFKERDSAKAWLPSLLKVFMENVIGDELKQIGLGHGIVQAARPRSTISPVLFGVAVSLDHNFGSRWLLDTLSRFGFCSTYDEVNRFKQSVIQSNENDIPETYPDSFTQWSADNVDHNINSLDGSGNFHGMGIISMSTSYNHATNLSGNWSELSVPRRERVKVSEVVKNKGIPILSYYTSEKSHLSKIPYKPLSELNIEKDCLTASLFLNRVWQTGALFQSEQPWPNWSGFMQDVSVGAEGTQYIASDIRMLPLIDLNPTDLTCIYSTLCYIEKQAHKLNIPTPCVTFDQPLWIKAVGIVETRRMNIVCRLGAFHVIMSYLGSIGYVMKGSGLQEALQCCFGPVSVTHMLTGFYIAPMVYESIVLLIAILLIIGINKAMMSPSTLNSHLMEIDTLPGFPGNDGFHDRQQALRAMIFLKFLHDILCPV